MVRTQSGVVVQGYRRGFGRCARPWHGKSVSLHAELVCQRLHVKAIWLAADGSKQKSRCSSLNHLEIFMFLAPRSPA
eukprot:scaffold142333_cov127-Phaeocystis_antarctica.AAC.1